MKLAEQMAQVTERANSDNSKIIEAIQKVAESGFDKVQLNLSSSQVKYLEGEGFQVIVLDKNWTKPPCHIVWKNIKS